MDNILLQAKTTPTSPIPAQEPGKDNPAIVLPSAIYNHLSSEKTLDVIYALEKEFAIPVDKIDVIPFILGTIISGELDPGDVVEAIQVGLAVGKEVAVKVAGVIKDKILNPIAGGLLLVGEIDIEPIPGPSAKDATDLPELLKELEPYLAQTEKTQNAATKAQPGASSDLEPLTVGPKQATSPIPPKPTVPGMSTPGLRMMKDVKPPAPLEVKKTEPAPLRTTNYPPTGQAGELRTVPKPFMLHEEKPAAPNESAGLRVEKSFSFDAGQAPYNKPAPRPVTAELNSSFDAMLDQKKPAAPVTAKTAPEMPKVIHYTSLKTPLDGNGQPKE